jgi:hypothetical protein
VRLPGFRVSECLRLVVEKFWLYIKWFVAIAGWIVALYAWYTGHPIPPPPGVQ